MNIQLRNELLNVLNGFALVGKLDFVSKKYILSIILSILTFSLNDMIWNFPNQSIHNETIKIINLEKLYLIQNKKIL